jgi:hypothetical protein
MAKITLENLVLRGVRVETGVENVRRASEVILAGVKTPATLSQVRSFAATFGQPHNQSRTPAEPDGTAVMDSPAEGAGRLQGSAGIPASRCPARSGAHPIRLGWLPAAGPDAGSTDCHYPGRHKGPGMLVGGPALRRSLARPLAAWCKGLASTRGKAAR